jgi:hypothetical protein
MKKGQCEVLDTYNDFSVYWADARFKSLKEKVRLWQASYMKKYPELLAKQVENYKEMGIDWHEVAEKIFSQIPYRLQLMQEARDNILGICGQIYAGGFRKTGTRFWHSFRHLRRHRVWSGVGGQLMMASQRFFWSWKTSQRRSGTRRANSKA